MISRRYANVLLATLGICILTAAIAATHGQSMPKSQAKEKLTMNSKTAQQESNDSCTCPSRTDADWKKILTPEQYHITRKQGTERAFTGKYWNSYESGMYRCVCCGARLFSSDTKFESGTGWPSFYEPYDKKNVATKSDDSYFMDRTEVVCQRCGAHLGHVFDDGPHPTGLRYCINSAALNFQKKGTERNSDKPASK